MGLLFGFYIGQKLNQSIKVLVTALTGANLTVFGITLTFDIVEPDGQHDQWTPAAILLAILLLFYVSYKY